MRALRRLLYWFTPASRLARRKREMERQLRAGGLSRSRAVRATAEAFQEDDK